MVYPLKVRIFFGTASEVEFSGIINRIYQSIFANAGTFPALPVAAATLLTQIQAYDHALSQPVSPTKAPDVAKARKAVQATLRSNGIYINTLANGNKTILEQSGYPIAKERLPVGRLAQTRIEAQSIAGGFKVTITGVKKARGYLVLYIAAAGYVETDFKDWSWTYFPKRSGRIIDMEPSTRYRLVSVALGTDPALVYSEPIERTTQ